jgi:low affinity Fe/Cu permease
VKAQGLYPTLSLIKLTHSVEKMETKKNAKSGSRTNQKRKRSAFEILSTKVSKATGSTGAFIIALLVILTWLITGPLFKFSDTWQLVINTGTTIITFLMVFLIQRSQNKDFIAIHLKLNELIVSQDLANNRLVSVEDISEEDLKVIQAFYKHLSELAQKEISIEDSHSIDTAGLSHRRKISSRKNAQKTH